MTRSEILQTLRATPGHVTTMTEGFSIEQLRRRSGEGEWSMGEIVNHLLLGERDLILHRFVRMRTEEGPVFHSSLNDKTGFAAAPSTEQAETDRESFAAARTATLSFLEGLSDQDWHRIGTTPTRGTLSIQAYAEYLARHDLEHLTQLAETIKRVR
jgi:hypothetical protein